MIAQKKFDICFVGPITKDIVSTPKATREMPGGVVYYAAIPAAKLGLKVCAVTKLKREDARLLEDFKETGVEVFWKESRETTIFENIYPAENPDLRIQKIGAVAPPFELHELPELTATFYCLGPLLRDDISLEIMKALSKQGKIALDPQGFLREGRDGKIVATDWQEKREGLRLVEILKLDKEEAEILTGLQDPRKAAAKLASWGCSEVIITFGSKGSLIFAQEKYFDIPAFPPRKAIDATGCGDTYMAGYLCKRLESEDFNLIGRFAAAAASLKLEGFGPLQVGQEAVEEFLKFDG